MTSINDTTILAMLSRYPGLTDEEADEHIAKIEHQENVPICHAVVGRVRPDELLPTARRTYEEFKRWSMSRTRRFKAEQLTARQQNRRTREAISLTKLHERGMVSDEFMLMYGIQGELPERQTYFALSEEEKLAIWEGRMEERFGPNWRRRFHNLPAFLRQSEGVHNWIKEGF